MAGISDKALKSNCAENKYKLNGNRYDSNYLKQNAKVQYSIVYPTGEVEIKNASLFSKYANDYIIPMAEEMEVGIVEAKSLAKIGWWIVMYGWLPFSGVRPGDLLWHKNCPCKFKICDEPKKANSLHANN